MLLVDAFCRNISAFNICSDGHIRIQHHDASIMNAAHDVEDLLKYSDTGIMYLPISMTFDEAPIPVQSQRPGQHPAFMVLSSATKPDGKPKSHFALSKLWIRRSVTQLPVQKLKDCVNPLAEMPKGDFRGGRETSARANAASNGLQVGSSWPASALSCGKECSLQAPPTRRGLMCMATTFLLAIAFRVLRSLVTQNG